LADIGRDPPRQRSEDKPRAPSGGTVEIKSPPGIEIIDRMVANQDRLDRAAAIRQRIESDWIEAHFDKGPRIETEYNPLDNSRLKE
jgi:hypothetical protein